MFNTPFLLLYLEEETKTSSEDTAVKHQDKQDSQEMDLSSTEDSSEDSDHTEAGSYLFILFIHLVPSKQSTDQLCGDITKKMYEIKTK